MTDELVNRGGKVVFYEAPDGRVRLDVRLERETVWLSLSQMAELFGRDKSVVSRHLRNVSSSGELERGAVVAKTATTASDGKTYQVEYFNLDAILSVGYRVNSKRGTQFRIWATQTLRDHLLRGFTLNEQRLRESGLREIEQAVGLLARTLTAHALVTDEGLAVLAMIKQYTRAWRWLVEFDEERLAAIPTNPVLPTASLSPKAARAAILDLRASLAARKEASTLFGREHGEELNGILGAIEQTSTGYRCTRRCRRGRLTCSTSSSRTTPSPMATNGSARSCSWTTCGAMACNHVRTAAPVSPTTRWSHSRSSWPRASQRKRT